MQKILNKKTVQKINFICIFAIIFACALCACTPDNPSAPIEGVEERFAKNEHKIADFSKGPPQNFWARNDRGNGGMFNCSFSNRNVKIDGGKLSLILSESNGSYAGAEYRTTARFGFGFYSVKMKPVSCSGVISSFFIYTNRPWDEIDIEFLGDDTTRVQFNYFHNGKGNHEYVYDLGFDASKDFHEYSFLWLPDSITWFVDGKPVYRAVEDIPQQAGHIMVNLWNVADNMSNWAGKFDPSSLPHSSEYLWIAYNNE